MTSNSMSSLLLLTVYTFHVVCASPIDSTDLTLQNITQEFDDFIRNLNDTSINSTRIFTNRGEYTKRYFMRVC